MTYVINYAFYQRYRKLSHTVRDLALEQPSSICRSEVFEEFNKLGHQHQNMIVHMIKEHCAPLGGTVVARYVANMGKVFQQNTNLYEIMHKDCKQQELVSFVDLSDLCLEVYQFQNDIITDTFKNGYASGLQTKLNVIQQRQFGGDASTVKVLEWAKKNSLAYNVVEGER